MKPAAGGPLGRGAEAALVVLLAAGLAAAALPTPTGVVRAAADGVIAVLRASGRAADRRGALERAVEPAFDFDDMARRALGPHWRARTVAERQQFTALFRGLLERAYVKRLEAYDGERVQYLGETRDGAYATVRTAIVTPRDTEIGADYRLHAGAAGWRIYDVRIDGVSLIENYRAQFDTVIDESSYEALVGRLEAKVTARQEGTR